LVERAGGLNIRVGLQFFGNRLFDGFPRNVLAVPLLVFVVLDLRGDIVK
jgi:hypothetical protein